MSSDFPFRADAGGGTLSDAGIHVLDLLSWWFGSVTVRAYRDDAFGGVEADCEIDLAIPSGPPGRVELVAEAFFGGRVELRLGESVLRGRPGTEDEPAALGGATRAYRNVRELFVEQLEDFADSVRTRRRPWVTARSARGAVAAAQRCKEIRRPLDLPWLAPPGSASGPRSSHRPGGRPARQGRSV